jgi:hypothetical protein
VRDQPVVARALPKVNRGLMPGQPSAMYPVSHRVRRSLERRSFRLPV